MSRVVSDSQSSSEESVTAAKTATFAEETGLPAGLPVPDREEADVARKMQRRLRRFLLAHPCPSRSTATAWVENIFSTTYMNEAGLRLRGVLEECECSLGDFH